MNRDEAEKLLAVLIFGDLDEASKTDLKAYLQTDDELRERLADMRMAVKVASDALQHGPDPVLGKRRLKRLARLARQRSSSRRSAVFTVRYMAAAAAILAVILLPSFLIFKGTDRSQSAYSLQSFQPADSLEPGIDIGGGYSFNENGKYDIEFTGGTSALIKLDHSMPDSYAETAEESLEGKKQFAKVTGREDTDGNGLVDQIQFSVRRGQVSAGANGKGVKFGDGHLTFDGDPDEIVGVGTAQVAIDAAVDGDAIVLETSHYYNSPTDAVAGGSSSGDVKGSWMYDYDGGPGGGQNKLYVDSVTGIEAHGATIRRGDEPTSSMDSSAITYEFDRRRSITAGAKTPDGAEKARPAPARMKPVTTRPEPLQPPPVEAKTRSGLANIPVPDTRVDSFQPSPVVVSDPSKEAEPKLRAEGWVREMGRMSTESEAAASIRKPPISNMIVVDGKKFNVSASFEYGVSGGGISEPSGTVHDEMIIDRQGKDQVSEEAGKRPTAHLEVTGGGVMTKADKVTVLSTSGFTVSRKAMKEITDSLTNGDMFEMAKEENESIPKDSPVAGPVAGRDDKRGFVVVDAEEMERTTEGFDDIVSVAKEGGKDAEERTGFEADLEGRDSLKVGNSHVPAGEDESDLPLASRFKSVPVNPWVMTERDSLSTFALDVDTASYTLCRRYIYGGFLPPAGAVRMEEFVNYFNYHYPQRTNRTFTVHAEAAPSPFAGKGKNLTLLKIGVKARTIGRDQRKAAHLILVVDTSASMGKPDRLGLVQQALNLLIDRLSAADRVTLITCANQARLHLEATSVREREKIRRAINAMQPSGPTNLLAGLKLGYAAARRSFAAKQINHVVLCSDGVANVGQTEADAVLKEVAADRKQGITITCVGVGYGSYNDAFLESLANRGDGSYVFLDSARQAQRVFVEQLAATLHTVAKDARIQVSFNPDRVRRYRLIGYENRDIEDKRFRDDTVDAGEVGSGQCSTALYELELTGQRSADEREGLGTVFVRYRHADTGRMEEISCRLKSAIVQRRKVESSPRFFLAAAASRFAEILRQSEHARQGSLTDVLAVAEKVSLALPLDRDVRQLVELIRKAEHLPRSQ